jgi:hypothetical protein
VGIVDGLCRRLAENKEEAELLGRNNNWVCNYLSLLYQSNQSKSRLPITEFYSGFLRSSFDPVEAFRTYLSKSPNFNFISYPFLLSFENKYKLMQIESIYEQKMSIRKNMENGLSAIFQNVDFNHGI